MFKKIPTAFALLLLSLLACHSTAFVVSVADDQEVEVIANPHGPKTSSCGAPPLLEPHQLILTPMATQPDTFQKLSYLKVLTVPVPVYSMKQPARLNEAQLPFQLVLVKQLPSGSRIHEVPVPMEKATDSWFPGYHWTPLVTKCGESNEWQHVGWKFTNNDPTKGEGFSHFYALMVQTDQKEEAQGLPIWGLKAPGWMVARVLS